MGVEPPQPVGDRIVVVGSRRDPRGGPLEHGQLADDRSDLGDQLHRARAGADHGHALAREIDRRIPPGRMERRTGEAVAALDVRISRLVELPHGAHDRVGNEGLLGAVGPPDAHRPGQVVVRPVGGQHLGRELDVFADAEHIGALLEVAVQHVLRREVERPVVTLCEGVAVVVVRVVDATPRIRVLPPGAADAGVLVDDHERHARLLQPVRGEHARHAGADDQDAEVDTGRELVELPARCTTVLAPVGEFLFEQREVGGHRYATDGELEDLEELAVRRRRCGATPVVAVPDQGLQRECPDGGRLLIGETGLRHPEEQWIGAQVFPEQREIARDVGERRKQRCDLGVVERPSDLVVVRGDRLDVADERARRRLGRHAHSVTPFGACWLMKPNM